MKIFMEMFEYECIELQSVKLDRKRPCESYLNVTTNIIVILV